MRRVPLYALCCALSAGAVHADTLLVDSLGDTPGSCPGPPCTLRAALAAAQPGDTVAFSPAFTYPTSLQLAAGELVIDRSLLLLGPGPEQLTISAGSATRVLRVASGTVHIEGLALSNGRMQTAQGMAAGSGTGNPGGNATAAEGGCVRVAAGASLQLERVALVSCQARGGDGGHGASGSAGGVGGPGGPGGNGGGAIGGAIASFGALTLIDSSVQGALAIGGNGGFGGDGGDGMPEGAGGSGGSGGVALGASLYLGSGAALVVRNSTLTGSSANGGQGGDGGLSLASGGNGGNGGASEGGALFLAGLLALADLEFVSLGPALLLPGPGGGSNNGGLSGAVGLARGEIVFAGSTPRVRHSVFAGDDAANDCHGAVTASGANFASDASCGSGFALRGSYAANFVGPGVQEVAGRAVLQPQSGALPIDAATDCNDLDGAPLASDGVGRTRPLEGDGDGLPECDLGAREFDPQLFGDGFEPL